MPWMGKTEEDWNGLKLGILKTVQSNSFSKFISTVGSFKNNAQGTYLFVSSLWFCSLRKTSISPRSSPLGTFCGQRRARRNGCFRRLLILSFTCNFFAYFKFHSELRASNWQNKTKWTGLPWHNPFNSF